MPLPTTHWINNLAPPLINVEKFDGQSLTTFHSGVLKNPWNAPSNLSSNGSDESIPDLNLARYLKHGRRHTLGAAQNTELIPPEEMNRLRKINECSSSQASSGFGSSGTNPAGHLESLDPALSTAGMDDSSQSSVGSLNSTSRQFLQLSHTYRYSRRRASDGGHYAAAYRMFVEKRHPIRGQMSVLQPPIETSTISSPNSVKKLLHEKIEADKRYGKPPGGNKQWLMYKNQLQNQQLSVSGVNPGTHSQQQQHKVVPFGGVALVDQMKAFQGPQHIQEQMQQLHLRAHQDPASILQLPSVEVDASPLSHESSHSLQNLAHEGSSDHGSNLSVNSRLSSGSSKLAQLLSPSSGSLNIPVPQPPQTPSASTAIYVNSLDTQSGPRRFSMLTPSSISPYSSTRQAHQKRKTLPELYPGHVLPPGNGGAMQELELPQKLSMSGLPSGNSLEEVLGSSSPGSSLSLHCGRLSPVHSHGGSPRCSPPLSDCSSHSSALPPELVMESVLGVPEPPRRRKSGVSLSGHQQQQLCNQIKEQQEVELPQSTTVQEGSPPSSSTVPIVAFNQPSVLINGVIPTYALSHPVSDNLHKVQQIPVYLNQHVSLLHPVANQIAQGQVNSLVAHISTILNKFGIRHENTSNSFTVSHNGVDFQIRVQVSPHCVFQNALQLNLQYMHISGDPQNYQLICTQLAPHFIPSVQ